MANNKHYDSLFGLIEIEKEQAEKQQERELKNKEMQILTINDFKVGQECYISSPIRGYSGKAVVVTVGSKYVTVEMHNRNYRYGNAESSKYLIEASDFISSHLYPSITAYEYKRDVDTNMQRIRNISPENLTEDQINRICDILDGKNRLETMPCKDGKIIAELGGDADEYRGIYLYMERPDGTQIDLCNAEGKYHCAGDGETPTEGATETVQDTGVTVRVWADPACDDFTDSFDLNTGTISDFTEENE